MSERAGWRLSDAGAPEPPIASVVDVVDLLIKPEHASTEQISDNPQRWLSITIQQFTILAGRLSHHRIFQWSRSSSADQTITKEGAASGSLSAESTRRPAQQEADMGEIRQKRFRAELQVLGELSKQKPATPEERSRVLEKRKREFDEAWGIKPESKTSYTPIRLVK